MADGFTIRDDATDWPAPDMTVTRANRRKPPAFPLNVLGPQWRAWVVQVAEAAGCPVDYVAGPLLAIAAALMGNARWAQATPGWIEPPHLWIGVVGDSGSGKSPGADALMRDVLPVIERRMSADFPERLRDWKAKQAGHEAALERWKGDVKAADKKGSPPPLPPAGEAPLEPQSPRLRQNDVTIEKVATLLATAAPKGLLIVRDELAGWLLGMTTYNDAGRAFWIESYGGRPYRVERQKHPQPIDVPRLVVGVTGGTQPEKLAELMRGADDGLIARIIWIWADRLPFRLSKAAPAIGWAADALDRLRLLDLDTAEAHDGADRPVLIPLAPEAQAALEAFAQDMDALGLEAAGLMKSTFGKARGTVLRLSLVLEYLWWCGRGDDTPSPRVISVEAFNAAAYFVADYLMPMAERVYGDAATSPNDRNASTLAKWILKARPVEVHVRKLQREIRLPGLSDAPTIRAAADALVEAGWLRLPPAGGREGRAKVSYAINPAVFEAIP